jgi:hypothetical protein
MKQLFAVGICAIGLLVTGCEKKPDLLAPLPDLDRDTAYVQLTPPFAGFTQAEDILIGNDQLLYVADTYGEGTGRIVMMNRAGQVLSTRRILRPVSITQDMRLDLIVGGTIVAANGDSVGALFRIHLVDAEHHLEQARIDTIWRELAHPARRFPGVAAISDNQFLVVRDGADNTSFVDPDSRVLQFDQNSRFITPMAAFATRTGTGITDIFRPSALALFPGSRDFVLAQQQVVDGQQVVAYGALWMTYSSTSEFEGWQPKYDPGVRTADRGIDFVRTRYLQPSAVAIDRTRRDIFVADAGLDSVFKFNSRGTFKQESFGRVRTAGTMQRPTGLAYFDRVLYVLDGDLGQILRFRLTTDVAR